MIDANDWAKNIEARVTARQVEEARQSSEFATRRELIKSHAPSLWEGLQESFKAFCAAFNALGKMTLVPSLAGPDLFLVKRDGGTETLTAVRDPYTHEVSVSPGRRYKPVVIANGDCKVAFSANGQVFSYQEIAGESLEYFITGVCRSF